ncbi:MAG: MarR family winged helix-turn-helix transcriptional regulator [Terriglobales bacterium]
MRGEVETEAFAHWRFFSLLRQQLAKALAPLELAPREFFLLSMVRERACPQRELAKTCGLDPSSMVPVVDALERRGWIERKRDARDRRVHLITLSPAGKRLHTRARRRARQMEKEQLQRLSDTERAQLSELLRKLMDA